MKKDSLLIAIAFGITIIYAAYQSYKKDKLEKHGRYTIGVTCGRQGKLILYKFEIDSIEYNGKARYPGYLQNFYGVKYYVQYLSTDPSVNKIFLDKPVPEDITDTPADGWTSMPHH